ncbi:MAG: caspase family protein [Leptospiraceae bacterium]|nr:caspase family protein [Leptospiraceae bacterium]
MTKFRKSFSFLLLLLALSSYGDDVPVPVTMGLKPIVTGTRIAFLVGINSYKATTSLKYAVGDSEAIEDLLLRTGKYDKLIKLNDYGKITTTLNPETLSYSSQRIKMAPTKANIEATYQEVLAEKPDTLLFYYSGHGFIEGEGGENFIAPKDVDVKFEKRKVGQVEKEVPIPLNGISLKVMGVQAAKVKRVVFLIDACRSPLPEAEGESGEKGEKALSANSKLENEKEDISNAKEIKLKQNILSVRTDKLPKRVLEAEGITMLIGAAPEVSSLEDEDFKSGIFTHFLKKAFNGGVQEENQEEYITEENLSRYIEDRFKQYYELRKKETESAAEPKLYNLTFDRGKKGEILISQHRPIEGKERIDKPIYTDTIRKREVKGKLVYNEKGEREDLRFFVHDKKRDLYYPDSLDGVYKMEYEFDKDEKGELEKFTASEFNLENEEVFEYGTKLIPDVGWEYRGIYDPSSKPVAHRKDLINQVPMVDPVPTMGLQSADKEKIRYERKIYDFNGNIISEEYFDSDGKLLEFDRVAKIVRAYDKYGQVALEEFYGKDTFDEYGDVTDKGNLIAKEGFARYKAIYKSKGNLLYETWEDVEGKIANTNFGYAKVKYIYDKNDRLIRKKYYDKENKFINDKWGVSVYSYFYDSNCIGMYESKIAEITKKENKTAIEDWKLGKYKLCLAEEIHTDKEGKPAGDEKMIYKKIRAFNEKGLLISEENFRPDYNRRHLENGVAKVVYTHDAEGNIISRKNYGEFEIGMKNEELRVKNEESEITEEKSVEKKEPVPVSDGNGVHEYRYSYVNYYGDGSPFLNECIYHRKDKGILPEPYGCALKIEHFGINGKPIENKRNVYRTNIYYTGAYQAEVDRHYYSLDNRNLWVEKKAYPYNPFGNDTLNASYVTKEGKEVLVWKYESKYDEKNNNTLYAYYETKEGKEVLFSKEEYKYDEKNNKSLYARYETKEGKEVLVRKEEYKYDEKNNKTLEARYETKEGKEVFVWKYEYKFDEKNNNTLEARYETKEGNEVLVWKKEYKYDEKNNKTLEALYKTEEGKEVLVWKKEYKYDEKNNKTLEALYKTEEGKEVLVWKKEYKYDEKNNKTLEARYETIEGKEVLVWKIEYKYDEKNNGSTRSASIHPLPPNSQARESSSPTEIRRYKTIEEKEVLFSKFEYKYDEKNNKTLEADYETEEGKEVLVWKKEYKYDEKNNKTLEARYETIEGKEVLVWKIEYKYDEKNNKTLGASYETIEGKEVLVEKKEYKYDEKNNNTLEAYYKTKEGKEVLFRKEEYKYDERNNKTLYAYYETKEGKEVLDSKVEWKYDEKNNKTLYAKSKGEDEVLEEKTTVDYRLESYAAVVTRYEPQIKAIEASLRKINEMQDAKDESEKKSLNKKLEDLKKEFEAKKKKYTLSVEKFGANEKLESSSYKLLFFNPRGPAEKRLMRVDLDRFYRPVKVGFEVE